MTAYSSSKHHISLNSQGYVIDQRNGIRYYQKKRSPAFVNKFGGGDAAYRDATFWQYFVQTNWRNGSKQLKFDDPGKFWKSSDVDTTQLEQLTLSKAFSSVGQLAAGITVNCMEAWRASTSWWNANYAYRQQLTVTAPVGVTVPANYPVKITINTATLESASKVRSDRKDWRVVYFNGSTWTDLTIDYVSASVTFFATQNSIASGVDDTSYYVYYGYSSESTTKQASTEADFNSVYGFFGTTPDSNSRSIWHFREGTGTSVNDETAQNNNATQSGGTWETTGKFGRHLHIPAALTTDKITAATSSDFDLGSMTLEGWVYLNAEKSDNPIFYRKKSGGSSGEYAFYFHWGNDLKLKFNTVNGSGSADELTATVSSIGAAWHHVACTYDGSTKKIFLDGALVGSKSWADGVIASDGAFYIGATDVGALAGISNMKFQHIRVSNVARTSFPYILSSEPTVTSGTETTTQPTSSSFDLYAGGSDGKVYKWDGVNTWTEQFDCKKLTWYDDTTLYDADGNIGDAGGTEIAQAQGFQLPYAITVKSVDVRLEKSTGTPGDITVRIETDSAGKPSGTLADANATTTITAFTDTSYSWITATFATAFSLSATTQYHLVLKLASGPNDNYYHWAADQSSPTYTNGSQNASADGGSTWSTTAGTDFLFRVLGQSTSVNCMKVSSVGGTQKLWVGTGDPTGTVNGNGRLYSYSGSTWALAYGFNTATESVISSMDEYTANSKMYLGIGPQAKVYESSNMTSFTLSKDINIPQNPGYIYAIKEYNSVIHAGGGSPEFLPTQYYNGFLFTYDSTLWRSLYPFDFTVIKALEFYDAYLFMGTYHGQLYVYDTSSLNPLFNFKDQYNYRVQIYTMKYFDDKLYMGLYPQDNSNETNVGIWLFDRRGITQAHTISGVTGYRCFAVVNGTLFVGTGNDGYVYKLEANTYKTQGWYQSSYFDANLPSIDKLYNSVTIKHEPLTNGQSIVVYYKFKESDSWTTLGTSNILSATDSTLSFSSGVYSKKISLKIELNTTDASTTPTLTEVVMQYTLYPPLKWQWTMRIKAKKNLSLLDRTVETRTANDIRGELEALMDSQQLYTYIDIDNTSYSVLVTDIDQSSWVVNQSDVNEDQVLITLLEA